MPDAHEVDEVEVLDFTPTRRDEPAARAAPIAATLCGHSLTWHEPKRAVLFFASQMLADEVSNADRASALLQLINGALDPGDQKRFMDAVIDRDDPVGSEAVFSLVNALIERWTAPKPSKAKLVIDGPEGGPTFYGTAPVRVRNDDLDLDVTAHPVKDLVLMLVSSGVSTTGSLGQQAWGVGTFLDACLDRGDAFLLNTRLRDRGDVLEIEDMVDVVSQLIDRWAPEQAPTNRAQRRARSNGKTSARR